jgi:hypothetical protein
MIAVWPRVVTSTEQVHFALRPSPGPGPALARWKLLVPPLESSLEDPQLQAWVKLQCQDGLELPRRRPGQVLKVLFGGEAVRWRAERTTRRLVLWRWHALDLQRVSE